jgi:hypothetical protein
MLVYSQDVFVVKILLPNDVLLKVELTSKLAAADEFYFDFWNWELFKNGNRESSLNAEDYGIKHV